MMLRPYQNEALEVALNALNDGSNPVLQLATGTGKSFIIAALATHYFNQKQKVWMLTHIQQLIQQNAEAYFKYSSNEYGIVCSGLGRCDLDNPVTFATIQSIKSAAFRGKISPPDLIIIDEAHRVPNNSDDPSTYGALLKMFPEAKRVAMTATPWRMDNGLIYGEGRDYWFDKLAYEYSVKKAVEEGYLCPLIGVDTEIKLDLKEVSISGDYIQREVDEKETDEWLRAVANSLITLAGKRKHIAVYCPTVNAANRAALIIAEQTGWITGTITGDMNKIYREEMLDKFAAGSVRALCSVDTITTGFDLPSLDCIACLRPTLSSSLWVQIQGRGTRLSPDKKNCLVLDYVGNLQRLGGVGMYDTYIKEKGGEAAAEISAVEPVNKKRERRLLPGLTSLIPIDPMTGNEALEGSEFEVKVHEMSAFSIVPRGKSHRIIVVQYTCTTLENARITSTLFIDTMYPKKTDLEFFNSRRMAVNLPVPANNLLWLVRNSKIPDKIITRKKGKYWNTMKETF